MSETREQRDEVREALAERLERLKMALEPDADMYDVDAISELEGALCDLVNAVEEAGFDGSPFVFEAYQIARAALASPEPSEPRPPTDAEIDGACMWFRHDFGLMMHGDRLRLRYQAKEWLRAWCKVRDHKVPPEPSEAEPDAIRELCASARAYLAMQGDCIIAGLTPDVIAYHRFVAALNRVDPQPSTVHEPRAGEGDDESLWTNTAEATLRRMDNHLDTALSGQAIAPRTGGETRIIPPGYDYPGYDWNGKVGSEAVFTPKPTPAAREDVRARVLDDLNSVVMNPAEWSHTALAELAGRAFALLRTKGENDVEG